MPSVFLDEYYRRLVQQHALTEGLLKWPADCVPMIFESGTKQNHGTARLFDAILLADSIDTHRGGMYWTKFHKYGVIPSESLIEKNEDLISELSGSFQPDEEQTFYTFVFDELLKRHETLASRLVATDAFMANDTRKYVESFPAHELIGIVKEMLLHFRQHVLGGMGFTEFPPFPPCTNTSESVAQIAIICAAFRQIELLIGDLRVGHAYSMKHGYHLCTLLRVNYDEFRHSTSRSVVDLVRLDFRNRFAYLPHPRCLEEAFEMRVDARLVRLRRKIDAWIRYSQGRSEDISSKIDNDIQRALKEISFVRKWENLKEGNLYIVFTAIAGQVPILSNVISGLTTIEQLISKHKEKHFGWIG